jgi:hypothetical protein
MWREDTGTGRMSTRKICPVMSDSRGRVLCQGCNCYSAYPRLLMGETLWFCTIIDGPEPLGTAGGECQGALTGEHEQ